VLFLSTGGAFMVSEDDPRVLSPVDYFTRAMVQGGPRLIENGKAVDLKAGQKRERFQDDVYRKCAHLAIGVTTAHKLIVCFTPKATLTDVTKYMLAHNVIAAMNMDGGHCAYLQFTPDADDKLSPTFNLGNPGKIYVGMQLARRKK